MRKARLARTYDAALRLQWPCGHAQLADQLASPGSLDRTGVRRRVRTSAGIDDAGRSTTFGHGAAQRRALGRDHGAAAQPALHQGTVSFQVVVSGGEPDAVELLANDKPLAVLVPPYQLTWDTNGHPEGTYQVIARATAHGQTYDSMPHQVVVDRSAPSVAVRTPAPGADGVRADSTIQVELSEPIAAATISELSVHLLAGTRALRSQPTLSADGKTLTIKAKLPRAVTSGFSVKLDESITDLAGNRLVNPVDAWAWTMPEWWRYDGDWPLRVKDEEPSQPQLQLDPSDRPVVVHYQWEKGRYIVYASRWSAGKNWEALGGALNSSDQASGGVPSLVIDSTGAPIVAFSESNSVSHEVRIVTWVEASKRWSALTTDHPVGLMPSLAIDKSNRLYLAYVDSGKLFVKSWTSGSASWSDVGPTIEPVSGSIYDPLLRVGPTGTVYVGYRESSPSIFPNVRIQQLDAGAWKPLGTAFGGPSAAVLHQPLLAIDGNGTPFLAVQFAKGFPTGSSYSMQVFQWDAGNSTWAPLGDAFSLLTQSGGEIYSSNLAIDGEGAPVLAYNDSTMVAFRWDAAFRRWTSFGWQSDTGLRGWGVTMAMRPSGLPVLAGTEYTNGKYRIFVDAFNR
jgi:hypothetical protein